MGWVVNAVPRSLYPWKRPGIHYMGGSVGPRAGLDECGFDPRTVQPVASRYTDWAIPVHHVAVVSVLFIYIWCVHLVGNINECSLLKVQNFTAVSLTRSVYLQDRIQYASCNSWCSYANDKYSNLYSKLQFPARIQTLYCVMHRHFVMHWDINRHIAPVSADMRDINTLRTGDADLRF